MKFAMNGALTIGTLDGANVEIREQMGKENFFLFGFTAREVFAQKAHGYDPKAYYEGDEELKAVIDLIGSGFFSPGDPGLFRPLVEALLSRDEYLVLADYRSYLTAQEAAGRAYADREGWTAMSIRSVARMGAFSSDRSIREYAEKIWKVGTLDRE
jgi:starch phosphorylase